MAGEHGGLDMMVAGHWPSLSETAASTTLPAPGSPTDRGDPGCGGPLQLATDLFFSAISLKFSSPQLVVS